ncbi:hypothetical protein KAX08_02515 [candidate division WOR-3 bacterium]|nr:hypothetical protein [candidate division WOR-3 bacterium]
MGKKKEGISMIIVLWIIAILTVLTTATALMTTSDIASTLNLVKRKRTIKSAETASEFVVSFLPKYKDLGNLVSNDTFMGGGDTVYGHKLFLAPDSQDIGVVTPLPLIRGSGTVGEGGTVNPILTSWALILEYGTKGMVMQGGDYLAQRRIQAAASFSFPGGKEAMGHTMY